MLPAMIFASRFALNGSSRHATIMAMGISIKTDEASKTHCGKCGASDRFGEPTIANRTVQSAYVREDPPEQSRALFHAEFVLASQIRVFEGLIVMARELLWLENSSFAAWGCGACNWIMPDHGRKICEKASASVREAFDRHECAKFSRHTSAKNKRPPRGRGL